MTKEEKLLDALEASNAFDYEKEKKVREIKLIAQVVLTKPDTMEQYTHEYISNFISRHTLNRYDVKKVSATNVYRILMKYPFFKPNKTKKGNNWSVDEAELEQFINQSGMDEITKLKMRIADEFLKSSQLQNIANHTRTKETKADYKDETKWVSPDRFREKLIMNATDAERKLYGWLIENNVKFKFQPIFYNSDNTVFCIPDFLINDKLIIELDGSSHKEKDDKDIRKMYKLGQSGYMVLHIPNKIIMEDFSTCTSLLSTTALGKSA